MIHLEFGANTDDDTWYNVFNGLVGYVLKVNDTDMVLASIYDDLPMSRYGLYGWVWVDDLAEPDKSRPVGFNWEDVTKVHIY